MDRKFEPVMIPGTSTPLPPQRAETVAVDSHRVLRNTYWLLALSMLPTIAGALAGMQLNFIALFKAAPIMTPLLMFGVMIGSLFVVTRLRDSAWGVLALFGFTFIAGLMLTTEALVSEIKEDEKAQAGGGAGGMGGGMGGMY